MCIKRVKNICDNYLYKLFVIFLLLLVNKILSYFLFIFILIFKEFLHVKISRDHHMENNPKKYIKWKKEDNQPYNERELKLAIKKEETQQREDAIHSLMI